MEEYEDYADDPKLDLDEKTVMQKIIAITYQVLSWCILVVCVIAAFALGFAEYKYADGVKWGLFFECLFCGVGLFVFLQSMNIITNAAIKYLNK